MNISLIFAATLIYVISIVSYLFYMEMGNKDWKRFLPGFIAGFFNMLVMYLLVVPLIN